MRLPQRNLKPAFVLSCATLSILVLSPDLALACAVGVPAPLIGVSGPYGIAAAVIGYGGFLIYKKLKRRS